MTFLPTDPAVAILLYRERSGHADYDRGIRDHMADARPGDPYGETWWWHKALTLAHLYMLPGGRYSGPLNEARRAAHKSLLPYGNAKALADVMRCIESNEAYLAVTGPEVR